MDAVDEGVILLRIYVGEADKHGHEALYKHLVRLLRERGVRGATVFRGIMGYGATLVLHATSPLRFPRTSPS